MNKNIEQLQQIIDTSQHIVFFTGAGVSTDSNIPDFRSTDGLYNLKYDYPPETILSHTFFMQRPEAFYDFYRDKMIYPDAKPNLTHITIAKLEELGKCDGVITQNIDGLHTAAGSKHVMEVHGTILKNRCMRCSKPYGLETIQNCQGIPRCTCGGIIKPEVVLYEEGLDQDILAESVRMVRNADTLIVCGTSLNVYPAAGLIHYFRGQNLVLINKSPTPYDQSADLLIQKPLSEVWSQIKL